MQAAETLAAELRAALQQPRPTGQGPLPDPDPNAGPPILLAHAAAEGRAAAAEAAADAAVTVEAAAAAGEAAALQASHADVVASLEQQLQVRQVTHTLEHTPYNAACTSMLRTLMLVHIEAAAVP